MTTDPVRRILAHARSPEEKLEQIVAEHRRELESQTARFEAAMQDLERREELLRDMRVSVDRLLRLGASDLTGREVELQELSREFLEREARLGGDEAEISRRRSELGAVELKREALEQRERALEHREAELAAREAQAEKDGPRGELEPSGSARASAPVELLFVPGHAYRLVEIAPRPVDPGGSIELEGEPRIVLRVGSSPLPADARRCAYLEPGARGASASDGSS